MNSEEVRNAEHLKSRKRERKRVRSEKNQLGSVTSHWAIFAAEEPNSWEQTKKSDIDK